MCRSRAAGLALRAHHSSEAPSPTPDLVSSRHLPAPRASRGFSSAYEAPSPAPSTQLPRPEAEQSPLRPLSPPGKLSQAPRVVLSIPERRPALGHTGLWSWTPLAAPSLPTACIPSLPDHSVTAKAGGKGEYRINGLLILQDTIPLSTSPGFLATLQSPLVARVDLLTHT